MRFGEQVLYGVLVFLFLLIYFVFDFAIDIYTDDVPKKAMWSIAVVSFAFMFQLFLRFVKRTDWKWFTIIINYLVFSGVVFLTMYFSYFKVDILGAALLNGTNSQNVKLESVTKHIASKGGFVGGYVDINFDNRLVKMECGRVVYFLLEHRETAPLKIGQTASGNVFVTDILLDDNAYEVAKSQYKYDWIRRHWVWLLIIAIGIGLGFIFNKTDKKYNIIPINRKPISWVKAVLIFAGLVLAILLLWILTVAVYNYFVSK